MIHCTLPDNLLRNLVRCSTVWLLAVSLSAIAANAQSPDSPKLDQFERDVDELFRELRQDQAEHDLDDLSPQGSRMRNLTPKQFEEFQQNFFERFFSQDKLAVEPADQETARPHHPFASIRNRRVATFEKQHESHLRVYRPVVKTARLSIVSIQREKQTVALGTVVDAVGSILTKASELQGADAVICIFSDGSEYTARLVGVNKEYDLALLSVDRVKTIPIHWSQQGLEIGSTVVTADQTGKPLDVGVVSVEPRALIGSNLAFLGVGPGPHDQGVEILNVERETAAARAGLQTGDVIVSLSDLKTSSVDSLVNAIRAHKPGTKVNIEYIREGKLQSTEAILDSASMTGDRELRMNLMDRMGTIISERNSEFPWVLQHDSPLLPEQCGGPLLDLDGNAIGINIARGGRVSSYAIPADRIPEIVRGLKSERN